MTGGSSSILSEALPTGTVSNMPWRKAGVTHPNNEIYIDIVEEIDAILSMDGSVISSDVSGSIQSQSNLSGVPDLLLTFNDATLIDDCSFHPCVRYTRFEKDRVVSFVPPDGPFELMRYRVRMNKNTNQQQQQQAAVVGNMPIQVIPRISYGKMGNNNDTGGRIALTITARSISSLVFSSSRKGSLVIEDVSVVIPFPKFVRTANLNVTTGSCIYDEAGKIAKWTIGKLDEKTRPQLNGSMVLEEGGEETMTSSYASSEEQPPLFVNWKILLASVSGLNVSGLSVTGEHYKPYKVSAISLPSYSFIIVSRSYVPLQFVFLAQGVRNITKSGTFQVRCH